MLGAYIDIVSVPLVQVERSDFRHMYTESPVDPGAFDTQHQTQINTGPLHSWREGGKDMGGRGREKGPVNVWKKERLKEILRERRGE